MSTKKVYRAIGLMSGTSLDGIDVALIETDGYGYVKPLAFKEYPYNASLRARIKQGFGNANAATDQEAIDLITNAHITAVKDFGHDADIIGFHGQTMFHDPDNGITIQIGDGQRLAKETGIDTVHDMRSADVAAGGQGAPLLPLYHEALVRSANLPLPTLILNIGGVSNITYIDEAQIIAFDTGPGNALVDDFVQKRTGQPYDKNGALAATGKPSHEALDQWLAHPYFTKAIPKSLDRDAWDVSAVEDMSDADGAATLSHFTIKSIAAGIEFLTHPPVSCIVAGGGRHNDYLMKTLQGTLGAPVQSAEALNWNGDATEAEGFAYLAVRSLLGEPLSMPTTTGVPRPMTGGILTGVHKP